MIRTATLADVDDIAQVHRAAILRGCVADYSATQIRAWLAVLGPETYPPLIDARYFRVALDDGAICGFASTTVGESLINTVYVAPFAFGQGVGAALVADAEEALLTADRREARLESTLGAVEFYRWLGYVEAGQCSTRLPSGVALAGVAMRKPLV